MKKIVLTTLVLSLFIITNVNAAFCCKDRITEQEKCYEDDDGECCMGYWYPGCYDFEVDVSGPTYFRISQKTPVTLYISNIGSYPDTYGVEAVSSDPSRILVDMSGASSGSCNPGQIKRLYPRITLLAPVVGIVNFTVNSS